MKKLLFIAFLALSTFTTLTVNAKPATAQDDDKIEIEFNEANQSFDKLLQSKLPIVVDFYATWCGPCKRQAPILKEYAKENKGKVLVVKVDVDKNKAVAKKYGIRSIPTLYIFKGGKAKWHATGVHTKDQIQKEVNKVK
ncbi:thioredoxin [Halosquirtibacter laminarini]|uniref:Thioredoxin n=1 Tax=Halosquirtibacter laminarini TaxID=3374600 RepID=A0AC61NC68_9BACT|nr:thioredoxin [Prolixibacteraceae bacterium]